MENSKKILFVMIIVMVVIIIIVISLLLLKSNSKQLYGQQENLNEETEKVIDGVQKLKDPNMFYSLANNIQTYLDNNNINLQTRYEKTIEEKEIAVYNILSDSYKKDNNITTKNIRNYMYNGEHYLSFYPLKAKELIEDSMCTYLIFGLLEDNNTGEYISEAYYIIRLDSTTTSYDIEPLDVKNIKSIDDIDIYTDTKNIKKNDNNKFIMSTINIPNMINRYIANYKKMAIKYPERAYENFDKEYREKRFGNLEGFKKYIEQNKNKISKMRLDKYQITTFKEGEEEFTQYICIDTNGDYLIFKEKSTMDYTLILDTYTVDIPEFLAKYENARPQEKVILNLNKFMLALNDQNYRYAYSVLADSFKDKNFRTEKEFEDYAKANLYEKNKFSFEEFGNEADTYYTYKIKITDSQNEFSNVKEKTFIMLLEEGTDFKISFNV